jgi:polyisoprenoid-binding protein YceI
VEAETGESGNRPRDKRMKKEILETDKYPEIRFRVTKLEGALSGDTASSVRVFGRFSIHGASHEISILLTVTIKGTEFSGAASRSPFCRLGHEGPEQLPLQGG